MQLWVSVCCSSVAEWWRLPQYLPIARRLACKTVPYQTSLTGSHLLLNAWTFHKFLFVFECSFCNGLKWNHTGPTEDSPPLTVIASEGQAATVVTIAVVSLHFHTNCGFIAFSRMKLVYPSILSVAHSSLSLLKWACIRNLVILKLV